MIRADSSSDCALQSWSHGHALGRHICWVKRLGDYIVRAVFQVLLELTAVTVLVRGDNKLVATILKELAKAELARDATKEITRGKVDSTRSRCRGTIRVLCDLGLF